MSKTWRLVVVNDGMSTTWETTPSLRKYNAEKHLLAWENVHDLLLSEKKITKHFFKRKGTGIHAIVISLG